MPAAEEAAVEEAAVEEAAAEEAAVEAPARALVAGRAVARGVDCHRRRPPVPRQHKGLQPAAVAMRIS